MVKSVKHHLKQTNPSKFSGNFRLRMCCRDLRGNDTFMVQRLKFAGVYHTLNIKNHRVSNKRKDAPKILQF